MKHFRISSTNGKTPSHLQGRDHACMGFLHSGRVMVILGRWRGERTDEGYLRQMRCFWEEREVSCGER